MSIMGNRKHTNRRLSLLMLTLAAPALSVGGMSLTALAQTESGENDSKPTCTLETLKGRYLFAWSGTVLPPAFGATQETAGGSAGYHTFNGDGTGTDTVTVRVGAQIVLENVVVP